MSCVPVQDFQIPSFYLGGADIFESLTTQNATPFNGFGDFAEELFNDADLIFSLDELTEAENDDSPLPPPPLPQLPLSLQLPRLWDDIQQQNLSSPLEGTSTNFSDLLLTPVKMDVSDIVPTPMKLNIATSVTVTLPSGLKDLPPESEIVKKLKLKPCSVNIVRLSPTRIGLTTPIHEDVTPTPIFKVKSPTAAHQTLTPPIFEVNSSKSSTRKNRRLTRSIPTPTSRLGQNRSSPNKLKLVPFQRKQATKFSPHCCKFCPANFTTADCLKVHTSRIHAPTSRSSFPSPRITPHSKPVPVFECPHCGEFFKSSTKRDNHIKTDHTEINKEKEKNSLPLECISGTNIEKENYCEVCDIHFSGEGSFRIHKKRKHSDSSQWRYHCDQCGKKYCVPYEHTSTAHQFSKGYKSRKSQRVP